MKGHIRERSPGHWAIVIEVRDPATNQRKRKWHSFRGTKREAQVECARLISELNAGAYLEPSKTTIAAFLDRWLLHMRAQLTPRSHERYSEIAHKNLVPLLGAVALTKLQPAMISEAYAKALENGRRDGKGGLSPATVHYMHRVLRQALQQAVRWQLLQRNPADAIKPPKIERKQMQALDADSTAALIEAARSTEASVYIPLLIGIMCGLRRGEIVALRWRAIDLDRAQLSVVASIEQTKSGVREKPPKSARGRRTVALPSMLVEELRQHRRRQAEQLLKLGVRLTDDHHVVLRADGQPIQPRSLTQVFALFLKRLKLPHIRLHVATRHTHATQMLAAGIHPKVAQERLGHSTVSITLDLYSHVLPGMQEEAADRVDLAVRDAINRRRSSTKG